MAKAPDPRALARKNRAEAAANYRLTIHLNGVDHVFRLADVRASDVAALRQATGWRVIDLARELSSAFPEADAVAAGVWLARRQAGERDLPYDAVADLVTVGSDYDATFYDDIERAPDDGGFPDPPASGGD